MFSRSELEDKLKDACFFMQCTRSYFTTVQKVGKTFLFTTTINFCAKNLTERNAPNYPHRAMSCTKELTVSSKKKQNLCSCLKFMEALGNEIQLCYLST